MFHFFFLILSPILLEFVLQCKLLTYFSSFSSSLSPPTHYKYDVPLHTAHMSPYNLLLSRRQNRTGCIVGVLASYICVPILRNFLAAKNADNNY
jgi:hypothetical protein